MASVVARTFNTVTNAFIAAVGRLDKSFSPQQTIAKLQAHKFVYGDLVYVAHTVAAVFWLYIMAVPSFPTKLIIPILYIIALLIPFTSQFFVPATPIFAWLLTFYSSKFIPAEQRPDISVFLLPTLESVLYGANISDILTRWTHPVLDIIAWIPYGVLHYTLPFVIAAFLWLFRPSPPNPDHASTPHQALHFFARAFGFMSLIGVLTQLLLPCAAPWYELIYGLTPATYDVKGSAAGLLRIDVLTNSHFYQGAFAQSPVVFGAFPSLHAGFATVEALFWNHYFPNVRKWVWAYTGVLYWSTMYLSHHYLVDVVSGACLAIACFYLFMPEDIRAATSNAFSANATGVGANGSRRSKYEIYDLEAPRRKSRGTHRRGLPSTDTTFMTSSSDSEAASPRHSDDEQDITYRSPNPGTSAPSVFAQAQNAKKSVLSKSSASGTKRSHRHTASIASLIRAEDRVDEGWRSPGLGGPQVPVRRESPNPAGKPDVENV